MYVRCTHLEGSEADILLLVFIFPFQVCHHGLCTIINKTKAKVMILTRQTIVGMHLPVALEELYHHLWTVGPSAPLQRHPVHMIITWIHISEHLIKRRRHFNKRDSATIISHTTGVADTNLLMQSYYNYSTKQIELASQMSPPWQEETLLHTLQA